jgi:hypothetical protein
MKKWFELLREENRQDRHHEIMLKEFGETKAMIMNGSNDRKIIRDENVIIGQSLCEVINRNSEKIDEDINKIESAKLNLSEFL